MQNVHSASETIKRIKCNMLIIYLTYSPYDGKLQKLCKSPEECTAPRNELYTKCSSLFLHTHPAASLLLLSTLQLI